MKLDIKFDSPEQAKEFADMLKDKNLQGVRIKQVYKKPEKGSLDVAASADMLELTITLGTLVIKSGVIPLGLREIHKLYKAYLDNGVARAKLKSAEKLELARIESAEKQKNMEAITLVALKQEETRQILTAKQEEEQKLIDGKSEDKKEDEGMG